jgi:acetoin utilization deacetylase AcuC-like enzyme
MRCAGSGTETAGGDFVPTRRIMPFLGRTLRRIRRRLPWVSKAPVQWVYSTRYRLDHTFPTADTLRCQRLVSYLEREGILRSGDLHRARRTTMRNLLAVHDLNYLRSLETAEGVSRVFGMPVEQGRVDDLLLWQRSMVGGTLLAARLALRDGITLVNLGGGLHHARADRGQGYCLFNDVAVAVHFLRRRWHFQERILVVDLDVHDGDGTRSFFTTDSTVHTFSIHNHTLLEVDAVEDTCIELGTGVSDELYLQTLRRELPPLIERLKPELVFYLAGSDVAHDDRHGDWKISEDAVLARDRFVMETLRSPGSERAVVVLLAGGYGLNAWRYSARFCSWLVLGRSLEPPSTQDLPLAAWRKIMARLSEPAPEEAEQRESPDPDDWGLTADDLPGPTNAPRSTVLGRFSVHAIELALERLGLMHRFRKSGYAHLKVEADLDHPLGQSLRVVSVAPERRVLFELRGRIEAELSPGFRTLFVEWMLSQNPGAAFSENRPGLPGQEAPGLNLLGDVAALLILAAEHLELDAVSFVPTYFSLVLQSGSHISCLDPVRQGELDAVRAALSRLDFLGSVSAVQDGRVVHAATGEPWRWEPTVVCVPVSAAMKAEFSSANYRETATKARNRASFHLMERSTN